MDLIRLVQYKPDQHQEDEDDNNSSRSRGGSRCSSTNASDDSILPYPPWAAYSSRPKSGADRADASRRAAASAASTVQQTINRVAGRFPVYDMI